ncbi:hypothetical protein [Streptomyces mirabilis]|uniref:hypothetical protein n=1 Tax=Streptomyces mirabilis TaxID=68239 RepID=UPI001160BD66|nr:hypothetical protein [Streptomyces mirabilis]
MSQWTAAAQQFAARIEADPSGVTHEQWRANAEAWPALPAAAERATGTRRNEWLSHDVWLRSWPLEKVGPREDIPLFDPGPVLERALDAVPMSRGRQPGSPRGGVSWSMRRCARSGRSGGCSRPGPAPCGSPAVERVRGVSAVVRRAAVNRL